MYSTSRSLLIIPAHYDTQEQAHEEAILARHMHMPLMHIVRSRVGPPFIARLSGYPTVRHHVSFNQQISQA